MHILARLVDGKLRMGMASARFGAALPKGGWFGIGHQPKASPGDGTEAGGFDVVTGPASRVRCQPRSWVRTGCVTRSAKLASEPTWMFDPVVPPETSLDVSDGRQPW